MSAGNEIEKDAAGRPGCSIRFVRTHASGHSGNGSFCASELKGGQSNRNPGVIVFRMPTACYWDTPTRVIQGRGEAPPRFEIVS